MSLILDGNIVKWLISLDIIKGGGSTKQLPNNKLQLDLSDSNSLYNGLHIAKILRKWPDVLLKKNDSLIYSIQNLNSLKNANTASGKLYNWNIICDICKRLSIPLDLTIKTMIVAGDEQIINEVLKDLYNAYILRLEEIKNGKTKENAYASTKNDNISVQNKAEYLRYLKSTEGSQNAQNPFNEIQSGDRNTVNNRTIFSNKMIDEDTKYASTGYTSLHSMGFRNEILISATPQNEQDSAQIKFGQNKELTDNDSCYEFFISTISKNFNLTRNQANSLLSQNCKYLAHIIVKGLKGSFVEIEKWYGELAACIDSITGLANNNPSAIIFVFQATKSGLISKNIEIARLAIQFFKNLSFSLEKSNVLNLKWEWLISESGGLNTFMNCIKRHFELSPNIVELIIHASKSKLNELFSQHLEKSLKEPSDQLELIKAFLSASEQTVVQDMVCIINHIGTLIFHILFYQLLSMNVFTAMIDFLFKLGESETESDENTNSQMTTLCIFFLQSISIISRLFFNLALICQLWKFLTPAQIEENEDLANKILSLLKKMARHKLINNQYFGIVQLFTLLDKFAMKKNRYAPIIYKTLTFLMIENHRNNDIREFFVQNFIDMLRKYSSMPAAIILEPLMKQIQVINDIDYLINPFDIKLLEIIALEKKLSNPHIIQILDFFGKITIENLLYRKSGLQTFIKIIEINIDNDLVIEYIKKFIKTILSMLFSEIKQRDRLIGSGLYKPAKEIDELKNQKQYLIAKILKRIMSLNHDLINSKIKELLLFLNYQIKQTLKHNHQDVDNLLAYFGRPYELMRQFKEQFLNISDILQSTSFSFENDSENNLSNLPSKRDSRNKDLVDDKEISVSSKDRLSAQTNKTSLQRPIGSTKSQIENITDDLNSVQRSISLESRDESRTGLLFLNRLKKKKVPLTKAEAVEQYRLNIKNTNKQPDQRILDNLELIKSTKKMQELKRLEDEEAKKQHLAKTKKALKIQLEKRKIELGIVNHEEKVKNTENQMIFNEGIIERNNNNIEPADLIVNEEGEENQIIALDYLLEKHNEYLRHLFKAYARTANTSAKLNTANIADDQHHDNDLTENNLLNNAQNEDREMINSKEIWKMLVEHNFGDVIASDEFENFIIAINDKLLNNEGALKQTFDFDDFKKILVQLSLFIYSRPPRDLSHMPKSISLIELIKKFKKAQDKNKTNNKLLLENEKINAHEQDNPENYNKEGSSFNDSKEYHDKNLILGYKLPGSLNINQSYRDCYSIIGDILKNSLQVHLREPLTCIQVTPEKSKQKTSPESISKSNNKMNSISSLRAFSYKKAQQPSEEPKDYQAFQNLHKKEERKIESRSKVKTARDTEEENNNKKKIDQVLKKQNEEIVSVLNMSYSKDIKETPNHQKGILQSVEQKRQISKILEKTPENKLKDGKHAGKNEPFMLFGKQNDEKLKGELNQVEQKRLELDQVKKGRKKAEEKGNFDGMKDLNDQTEEEKKDKELINVKFKSIEIQEFFQRNKIPLKALFKRYVEYFSTPEDEFSGGKILKFQSYVSMMSDFSIFPIITSKIVIDMIFRSITQNKAKQIDMPIGLNLDEFFEALLRIASKSYEILDKIYQTVEKSNSLKSHGKTADTQYNLNEKIEVQNSHNTEPHPFSAQMDKLDFKNEKFMKDDDNNNQQDSYPNIIKVTSKTMQGLLWYFELPNTKHEVFKHIEHIRSMDIQQRTELRKGKISGSQSNLI